MKVIKQPFVETMAEMLLTFSTSNPPYLQIWLIVGRISSGLINAFRLEWYAPNKGPAVLRSTQALAFAPRADPEGLLIP
jgi:hypothetical protein